ncbi:hypothetical protein NOM01_01195 [Sporolactobacillus sp. STSJ-5]|uniref:hypothetical protein n=1 Tax=Sporolactobacillus sp. STSJ-5 TaxID=2965076 RepID=UPI002107D880|nr:hypothetical protein [Sporolactobacillus sp. STSJ-5]MCQ2008602.1 hypothetical protein [Sporolactobacillus sp. STSJ-5]
MSYDFFDEDRDRKKNYSNRRHDDCGCYDPCEKKCGCNKCKRDDDEQGLLREFNNSQTSSLPVIPGPVVDPTVFGTNIAQTQVCVADRDERVELNATIEWTPAVVVALVAIVLGVPVTFQILRVNECGNGPVPIFATTDSSPALTAAAATLLATAFSTVTTSFHAVDENPPLGENQYFLTYTIDTVTVGGAIIDLPTLFTIGVTGYSLSAAVIDENAR